MEDFVAHYDASADLHSPPDRLLVTKKHSVTPPPDGVVDFGRTFDDHTGQADLSVIAEAGESYHNVPDNGVKSEVQSRPSSGDSAAQLAVQQQHHQVAGPVEIKVDVSSAVACDQTLVQEHPVVTNTVAVVQKEWLSNGFPGVGHDSSPPFKTSDQEMDSVVNYNTDLSMLSISQTSGAPPGVWLTVPTYSMSSTTTATHVDEAKTDLLGAMPTVGSLNAMDLGQQASLIGPGSACDSSSAVAAAAAVAAASLASCGMPKLGAVNHGATGPLLSISPKISARHSEEVKVNIPKLNSPYGFRYTLESPSSSSARKDEDRITYVNKGQFYAITLEYIPQPGFIMHSNMVKSVIMVVFREGKTEEEELEAWKFWHTRQHSMKHRIIDIDMKNSAGLQHCVAEVAHNAIAIYWNPLDGCAKATITIQCLSTDFSTQKGVKGLPLHLQIDTYENPRDGPYNPPDHRGYAQIKIFCDKGAERKARDEERRATKRRSTATGKRRLDDLYHQSCERSEFYSMKDVQRRAVLFIPQDSLDQVNGIDYAHPEMYSINDSTLPFAVAQSSPSVELAGVALSPNVAESVGFATNDGSLIEGSVDQSAIKICPSAVTDIPTIQPVTIPVSPLSTISLSSPSVQYFNQLSSNTSRRTSGSISTGGDSSSPSFDSLSGHGPRSLTSIIDESAKKATGASLDAPLSDMPYNLVYYEKEISRPTDLSQHGPLHATDFNKRHFVEANSIDNVDSVCISSSLSESPEYRRIVDNSSLHGQAEQGITANVLFRPPSLSLNHPLASSLDQTTDEIQGMPSLHFEDAQTDGHLGHNYNLMSVENGAGSRSAISVGPALKRPATMLNMNNQADDVGDSLAIATSKSGKLDCLQTSPTETGAHVKGPVVDDGGAFVTSSPAVKSFLDGGDVHTDVMNTAMQSEDRRTLSADHGYYPTSRQKSDTDCLHEMRGPKQLPAREDRIMIFVRQDSDSAYTTLHLVPPNVSGLISAIGAKYQIDPKRIRYLYRKNKAGIVAKIDDDMLKFYCNEDVFLMQVIVTRDSSDRCQSDHIYDITLVNTEP